MHGARALLTLTYTGAEMAFGRGWGKTNSSIAVAALAGVSFIALSPSLHAQSANRQSAAAQSPNAINVSVPAGALESGILALGRQANLRMLYPSSLTSGKRTGGVSGRVPLQQAVASLLAGTGLSASFTGANTVRIYDPSLATSGGTLLPEGAFPLDTIDVQGQGATTEGTNSYGSSYTTLFKDGASIKETPQSVSVITNKHIEDQNLTTLDKAIANTTGMTVFQGDSDRPYYFSRGFQVNTVQFDGVPVNAAASPVSAQDLAMFDRVEVLRGPAGLLSGLGSAGGTLNLVPKMPLADFRASNELSAGSYGFIRNQFDVTGPLNAAGTVRGRIVGTLQSQDFVEDHAYRRLGQIYGVLEGDISDNTTVRVGAYYQRRPARLEWSGKPATSGYTFPDVPRSLFSGAPWSSQDYMQSGAFGEIEHKFDNGWSTKATLNYIRFHSDVIAGRFYNVLDPVTLNGPFADSKWMQDDQQTSFDWHATGPVSLFGRTHKFLFGVDASHEDLEQKNFYCPAPNLGCDTTQNLFNLDSVPQPAFDGPVYGRHTYTNKLSVYGSARISLADPLTLVLGGRVLWWDSKFQPNADENYYNLAATNDRISAKPIPFAGLIYDLNKTYSVYASYAQVFEPQTTRNAAGDLLNPVEGEQYEVGVKGSYFDGRLNASVALYNLTQQNRAMSDPSDPSGLTYFAQGKARAQGVELEVSGRVTDRWNIFAGYTYTDTKNYDNSANGLGVPFSAVAPAHLFKIWTTYNLPGQFDKWTVGGGVYATSKFWNQNAGGRLVADSYVNASAMVSYRINDTFVASLNVDNLFDTSYITSLQSVTGAYFGAPRTFTVKLRAQW